MRNDNNANTRRALAILASFFLLLTFAFSAFAEGGNGDGTGGGKDKPLALDSSSITNGMENVPLKPEIVLNFNKNVVHFTVRDNNMNCFTMTDDSGKNVPVDVIMGDDQVDPTIKRIVTVIPKNSLEPGTVYLLKISKNLTSKSEVTLGKDLYISFTTQAQKTTAPATTTAKQTTAKASADIAKTSSGTTLPAKSSGRKASSGTVAETSSQSITSVPAVTAGATHQVTTSRVSRTTTTRSYGHSETIREDVTSNTTAALRTTSASAEPAAKKSGSTHIASTVTAAQTTETVYSEQTFSRDSSLIDYSENDSVLSETASESFSPFNDNPVDGPYYSQEADTAESEENETESGESGIAAYLPYFISGSIAIIAVPAIVIIIKKRKK